MRWWVVKGRVKEEEGVSIDGLDDVGEVVAEEGRV